MVREFLDTIMICIRSWEPMLEHFLSLGSACIEHARTFFNRPDYNLAAASPGTFALRPIGDMIDRLVSDHANTRTMIFGNAPDFDDILSSIGEIEDRLNN